MSRWSNHAIFEIRYESDETPLTASTLTLNFVGDVCLSGIDPESFKVFPGIKRIFDGADLNIGNLEAPLTSTSTERARQPVILKAEPQPSSLLGLFDVLGLANNHILDGGCQGLEETRDFLNGLNKKTFGAGLDEQEAIEPLRMEVAGWKLAFLGFTRWYNAQGARCGTAPWKFHRLSTQIRRLKAEDRFVILTPHWNYEHVDYPSPIERNRARRLIDCGADLIVGSHPHRFQGWEVYREKYIFHSLGNFIFHPRLFPISDPELFETAVLTVKLRSDGGSEVNLTPIQISDDGLSEMDPDQSLRFLSRLERLCRGLTNNRTHRRLFYADAKKIIRKEMKSLKMASGGRSAVAGLLPRLLRVQRQDVLIKLHSLLPGQRGERSEAP